MKLSDIYKTLPIPVIPGNLSYNNISSGYDQFKDYFKPRSQTLSSGQQYSTPSYSPKPNTPSYSGGGMPSTNMGGGVSGPAPKSGGSALSPEELAYTANAINQAITGAGDVPKYTGNAFSHPNASSEQIGTELNQLNDYRNDMVMGATDPYSWGAKSGIPYSAQQLGAIEHAAGGIYDPALASAKARFEHAQNMEEINAKNRASSSSSSSGLAGLLGGGLSSGKSSSSGQSPIQNAQDVRSTVGNVRGYIAKLRGGTSFTPNEEKLLDTYTPALNDTDSVIESKLRGLNDLLATKKQSLYSITKGKLSNGQESDLVDIAVLQKQINDLNDAARRSGGEYIGIGPMNWINRAGVSAGFSPRKIPGGSSSGYSYAGYTFPSQQALDAFKAESGL